MPLHEERRAELRVASTTRWWNAKRLRARGRLRPGQNQKGRVPAPLPGDLLCGTRSRATETVAFVRLRGRGDRAVKVRLCAVMNRAVSNRNCVGAIRGGEQRNENDQSVTEASPDGTSQ